MEKIDFKKTLKQFYQPSAKEIAIVDVPPMNYLMIDGMGDPNYSQDYADSITALYSASYALKFMAKKSAQMVDYAVMPLEGLWWVDDMSTFSINDKAKWQWTSMIMQPDVVSPEMVELAIDTAQKKKPLAALSKIRFETFAEGKCAQIMHMGPFSAEGPTIEKLHQFIIDNQHSGLRGKHHEIYLSDFRKADPTKWKTIIRQPMM